MNRTMKRIALPIGAAALLGSSGFAFMAANSVPETNAGEGSGLITGYTVSNVTYFDNNNTINLIRFAIDKPARVVNAWIVDTEGVSTQYTCTNPSGNDTSWQCAGDGSGVPWADAEQLRVRAYQ